MSVCLFACLSLFMRFFSRPLIGPHSDHMTRSRPLIGQPSAWKNWSYYTKNWSYYMHWAHLITRVEPIILHAWSPKNGGWVQSVHRPRVEPSRGRVYAWTRGHVNRPIFFSLFFLLSRLITQTLQNCIGPTIRIGREIRCLPYAGFFVIHPIHIYIIIDIP